MDTEYNWKAILFGAVPVSIILSILYFNNVARGLINLYLIIGILISIGITYYFDKKKQNIFTSPFIVVIVALTVHGLKSLNLF